MTTVLRCAGTVLGAAALVAAGVLLGLVVLFLYLVRVLGEDER
ncbi:hypothetical protein [Streptomyces avicenniae]|nr:hypothetical protein [Streptomyces avicenniae]